MARVKLKQVNTTGSFGSGLWTASLDTTGDAIRQSNVIITGSLSVSQSIVLNDGGLVDGVDVSLFSSSTATSISTLDQASSSLASRVTSLESGGSTSAWTSSNGIITRESDVQITGSLNVSGDINGISLGTFSSSIENRTTNLETDSGSFSSRITTNESSITSLQTDSGSFSSRITTNETDIDNLQADSGSFSTRNTLLEASASDFDSRLDSLEANPGFWTASADYISRDGDVQISGSLEVSGSINGINLTQHSSSVQSRLTTNETNVTNLQTDSGSFSSRITTNTSDISNLQTDSASFSSRITDNDTDIANLQTDSGSFSDRTTLLESTASAHESDINALQTDSGSFSTRITTNESNITNLQTDSGSFSSRITTNESDISSLQSASGSFSTRVTTNETNISNLQTDSGSFSTRITGLESDSGSFSSRITTNESDISSLQTDSSSFSTRITDNEQSSGSFQSRITSLESSPGGVWTSSADYISRASDVQITGSLSISAGITGSSLLLDTGVSVNEISNDTTLGGNSAETLVTELAVKTYVDNQVFQSASGSVAGSGSTGRITVWDSISTISSSNMVQSSGRIGIGTSNPQTQLHVAGTISASNLDIQGTSFNAFSSSLDSRLTTNESDIDSLQVDSGSFSTRISSLESNPSSLWTGSSGIITRESDVQISGSLNVSGSLIADGINLTSLSSSVETRITSNDTDISNLQSDSASFSSRITDNDGDITNLQSDSGSFSTRITSLESSPGGLWTSSADYISRLSDVQISGSLTISSSLTIGETVFSTFSSSLGSRIDTNSSAIGDLQTDSGSFSGRITLTEISSSTNADSIQDLQTDSGSFSTRVTTLENTAFDSLWTGSTDYISRESDVQISGSLNISSSLTINGVEFTTFSSSIGSRIDSNDTDISNLQIDSSSFSSRITTNESNITNLQTDSGSFSDRTTLLESTASNHESDISSLQTDSGSFSTRITDLEDNSSGLWTASVDYISRDSDVQISGSLNISSSLTIAGIEFSTFSSSVESRINSNDADISNLQTDSGSFSTRVTNNESNITALQSDSGSDSIRLTLLESTASKHETDSGSFSSRITNLEDNTTGLWSSSADYISRNSDVQISGSLSVSGSLTADGINLTSLSSSISNRETTNESNISSLQTDSGSFSTRVTNLEATENDYWTGSGDGSISRDGDVKVTGSFTIKQINNTEGLVISGFATQSASVANMYIDSNGSTVIDATCTFTNPSLILTADDFVRVERRATFSDDIFIFNDQELRFGNPASYSMEYNSAGDYFQLTKVTQSSEGMYIDNQSNFGFGVISPSEKLHVSGNISASNVYAQNLIDDSGSLSSRITTLEGTEEDFWTGSSGYISRQSDVQISGSLYISSSLVADDFSLSNGTFVNDISTDTGLSGNSDESLVTERAIKTYVDDQVFQSASGSINGSGSFGRIAVWNSSSSISSSNMFQSNDSIGIGTENPATLLHVFGTVSASNLEIEGTTFTTFTSSVSDRLTELEVTSSDHASRITTLESQPTSFWTGSNGDITRQSDVEITGSLYISSSLFVSGTDIIGGFSSSAETRLTDLEADSGSFSNRITGLETDSGSFSLRTSELEATASDHATRIDNLEASPSGLWTGSNGTVTRLSDVQISGSLYVSSSLIVNGVDLIDDFSSSIQSRTTNLESDSGSFSTRVTDLETDSGSFSTRVTTNETDIGGLQTDSGSFSTRITAIETAGDEFWTGSNDYISRLGDVQISGSLFVSESLVANGINLTNHSSSVESRLTLNESDIDSLQTDSGSFSTRVTLLEATASDHDNRISSNSSSFSSRITTNETDISSLQNASSSFASDIILLEATASNHESRIDSLESSPSGLWSASNGTISRLSDVQISGSLNVSSSLVINGTDVINDFSSSIQSRVTTLESDVSSLQTDSGSFSTRITDNESDISTLQNASSSFASDIILLEATASKHESDSGSFSSRITSLENAEDEFWTGSSGYISRLGDVQISGSLFVSESLVANGINLTTHSSSVESRLTTNESDIDNLQTDSGSFSTRVTSLENNPSGLWTSSDGYINRESDVRITGSLDIQLANTQDRLKIYGQDTSTASYFEIYNDNANDTYVINTVQGNGDNPSLGIDADDWVRILRRTIFEDSLYMDNSIGIFWGGTDIQMRMNYSSETGIWRFYNSSNIGEGIIFSTGSLFTIGSPTGDNLGRPDSKLSVYSSITNVPLLRIGTNDALVVSGGANYVGMGTADPVVRLHVVGDTQLSGTLNVSESLVADGINLTTFSSSAETRITTLENQDDEFWTGSSGYISRLGDVQISGSLYVSQSLVADGINLTSFSSSVQSRFTTNESNITNLQTDSASFSTRMTESELTASNHETRLDSLEAQPSSFWTGSNGVITRESDVQVTGSVIIQQSDDINGLNVHGFDNVSGSVGKAYINSNGNFVIDAFSGSTNPSLILDAGDFVRVSRRTSFAEEVYVFDDIDFRLGSKPSYSMVYSSTSDYLRLAKINQLSDGLFIDASSNFGLGIGTPSEKLHVVGNITASNVYAENLINDSSSVSIRLSSLEATEDDFWTGSNGYISRLGNVQISGSLYVSSSLVADGIDLTLFSSSVESRFTTNESDTTTLSSSLSLRTTELESTASDHATRITNLEGNPSGLWTASNDGGITRESTVRVTGSLDINTPSTSRGVKIYASGENSGSSLDIYADAFNQFILNATSDATNPSLVLDADDFVKIIRRSSVQETMYIFDNVPLYWGTTVDFIMSQNSVDGVWRFYENGAESEGLLFTTSSLLSIGTMTTGRPTAKLEINSSVPSHSLFKVGDTALVVSGGANYVGIGTDEPISRLHVVGNTQISGTVNVSSSLTADGINLTSFSSSVESRLTTVENASDGLWTGSGDYINRLGDVQISGSLYVSSSLVADGINLTSFSSSVESRLSSNDSDISDLQTDSGSFSIRLTEVEATASKHETDSGSFSTRITSLESSDSNLWTSSADYINRESDVRITGSLFLQPTINTEGIRLYSADTTTASYLEIYDDSNDSFVINTVQGNGDNPSLALDADDYIRLLRRTIFEDTLYMDNDISIAWGGIDLDLQMNYQSVHGIWRFYNSIAGFQEGFLFTTSSNLSIGTTTTGRPTAKLELNSVNEDIALFKVGDTALVVSGGSHYVGIGTDSPVVRLHVSGNTQISGTLDVSGSLTADGINLTNFSSSVESRFNTNESNITNLQTDSGSFSTRVTILENNPSGLWTSSADYINRESDVQITGSLNVSSTLVADGINLTSLSSSVESRLTTNEANITNLQTDSGSFSTRVTTNESNISDLQTDSGSFSTRVTTLENNPSGVWTSSNGVITRESGVKITGSLDILALSDTRGLRIYGFDDQSGSYLDIYDGISNQMRIDATGDGAPSLVLDADDFVKLSRRTIAQESLYMNGDVPLFWGGAIAYRMVFDENEGIWRFYESGDVNEGFLFTTSSLLSIGTMTSGRPEAKLHINSDTPSNTLLNVGDTALVVSGGDHYVGIGTASPITRLHVVGNTQLSGTLNVSSSLVADGINLTNFSSSVESRLTTVENDSGGLWTSSADYINRESDVQITGSLYVSSGLTVGTTNIIDDFSSSIQSRVTTNESNVSSLQTDSGSFSDRITLVEATASNHQTDSASFSSRITSNDTDIANLQADSGSFSTRVTTLEAAPSSLWTSSNGYIERESHVAITGSLGLKQSTAGYYNGFYVSGAPGTVGASSSLYIGVNSTGGTRIETVTDGFNASLEFDAGDFVRFLRRSTFAESTFMLDDVAQVFGGGSDFNVRYVNAGDYLRWAASGLTTVESLFYLKTGAFGFGQAAPTAKVEINSTELSDLLQIGSDILFVSASGEVGIGTTSPTEKLHLVGSSILGNAVASDTHQITGSVNITGSLLVDGVDVIDDFSASIQSRVTTLENAPATGLWTSSADYISRESDVQITGSLSISSTLVADGINLTNFSSSAEGRLTTNESNISSLQTNSGSFSSRITTNEIDISNLQTDSASFSNRITTNETDISALQTDSGSFSTRVTTLESNSPGLWTGSGDYISRESDVQITGSLTVSGYTVGSKTTRHGHTYTIAGTIASASGQTDFINPFFVDIPSGQTIEIAKARYILQTGTQVKASVHRNGTAVSGLDLLAINTTAQSTTLGSSVTLSDGDQVSLVVDEVTGSCENLSFTIFLDYTI